MICAKNPTGTFGSKYKWFAPKITKMILGQNTNDLYPKGIPTNKSFGQNTNDLRHKKTPRTFFGPEYKWSAPKRFPLFFGPKYKWFAPKKDFHENHFGPKCILGKSEFWAKSRFANTWSSICILNQYIHRFVHGITTTEMDWIEQYIKLCHQGHEMRQRLLW